MKPDTETTTASAGLLASPAAVRAQNLATRLRFVLAVPAAAFLVIFTDRGPVWPGAVIALAGEGFQLWATAHLRKNVCVVKSGPYAWLRNPMYVGRYFVGLGLALLTWRWFMILPYAVFYWVYAQARVLGEERRLRELFGEEYIAYCTTVRRWLPRTPRERLSQERWSWDAVLRNHELRVAAAVTLALMLLAWRVETFGSFWGAR